MDPEQPKVVEESSAPKRQNKHGKKHEEGHKHEQGKKPRHPRPEFDRNADLITIDTVLEPLPKKNEILAKPVREDYEEKAKKCRERITKLIEKKKQIRAEKYKAPKVEHKGEGGVHGQFREAVDEFKEMKERFAELREKRDAKRKLVGNLIAEAKENNEKIKKYRHDAKYSREAVEEEIDALELKLRTADLSKEDEKALNIEITTAKRKLKDAVPSDNVEAKLAEAEQRKEELDHEIETAKAEKEPLETECNELKLEMDEKNKEVESVKKELQLDVESKNESKIKNDSAYEQWKEDKRKRLDDAEAKIKEIDADIKKIWDEFHTKSDKYWEQKHKLDHLEWQHRVQKRKIDQIEREKRKAVYEQREKEREKEEQLKKYSKEIETCNLLVNYLRDLQREQEGEKREEKKVQEEVDINETLHNASEWKKEKGLEVLQSKKSKEDESPVKKGKKYKKKPQEEEKKKKFEIPLQIDSLFDSLKVLAPESPEEIEKKIAELREREALFARACSEEVSEEDQATIQKIKGKGKAKKEKKAEEKKGVDEEFPTL